MKDFDWVAARSSCALSTAFERLKLQVEEDVKTRNLQLQPARIKFRFIGNGSSFAVAVEASGISGQAIKFSMTETAIVVSDAKDQKMFDAVLTLSDDGECRLKVDGQERDFWQFRKQALEGLFFAGPWLNS